MKGYRKISDGYIEITSDEATRDDIDLEDNLIKEVNHAVTGPILDHAKETGRCEYRIVIYAKEQAP